MRHDYRLAAAALMAAAALAAAGMSAADDHTTQTERIVAQATVGVGTEDAARAGELSSTVIDKEDVQAILGRQVVSSAGEDMGRVIDIVVDRTGQVRAAVIDFGGFLGVGNRKVACDWAAFRFSPTGGKYDRITLDLTRDQVNAAPEYRDGRSLIVVGAPVPR
jgi:hypothetical protein